MIVFASSARPEMVPAPNTLKRLSSMTNPNSVLYQARRLITSRSSIGRIQVGRGELILDARVEVLGQKRQMAEDIVEHIRFRRELHLVAGAQVIGDQENALRKLDIPVIRQRVTDSRALDAPAGPRLDAFVEMHHRRDALRIELEQRQSIDILLADVLQQIGLMDPGEQVSPDRMLLIREGDFLGVGGILPGWIKLLFGNITCIDGWILCPWSWFFSFTQQLDFTMNCTLFIELRPSEDDKITLANGQICPCSTRRF